MNPCSEWPGISSWKTVACDKCGPLPRITIRLSSSDIVLVGYDTWIDSPPRKNGFTRIARRRHHRHAPLILGERRDGDQIVLP